MTTSKSELLKGNVTIELQERTIENPGKGNCGFYAFAIGLIDIIQEERTYNRRAMFDRWVQLDSSVSGYYDAICNYDFKKPNYELLESLHRVLRLITFNLQLAELRRVCAAAKKKDEYKDIVATSTYRKFAELYYGKDVDPRFNEFAHSDAVKRAIAKIDRSKVVPEHEALVLAPVFLSLMYGEGIAPESITPLTELSATSPIVQALQNITEDYVWANHLELDYLANGFEVNLHTLENGQARYPFQDLPERHTVTVNNQSNVHWTTKVTLAKVSGTLATSGEPLPSEKKSAAPESKLTEEAKEKKPAVINPPAAKTEDPIKKATVKEPAHMKTSSKKELESQKPLLEKKEHRKKVNNSQKTLIRYQSEEIPLRSMDPDEQEKMEKLIRKVNQAVRNYCNYSDSLWFSLFHRHGEAGRTRAKNFNLEFAAVENYDQAQELLVDFLKSNKNGNTHPHSFRTMLLQQLLDSPQNKMDLYTVSKKYKTVLTQYEDKLSIGTSATLDL